MVLSSLPLGGRVDRVAGRVGLQADAPTSVDAAGAPSGPSDHLPHEGGGGIAI